MILANREAPPRSQWELFWRRFLRHRMAVVSTLVAESEKSSSSGAVVSGIDVTSMADGKPRPARSAEENVALLNTLSSSSSVIG